MRAFLLEDDPLRVAWFESRFPDIVVARTVAAALYSFEGLKPDFVFLDHDLDLTESGNGYYAPRQGDGTAFVNSVLCQELRYPGLRRAQRIVIHSMNPVGSYNMWQALDAVGIASERIPFSNLKERVA